MPELISEETETQLSDILSQLEDRVQVLLFTDGTECPACQTQREILATVTALSDRLDLTELKTEEHGQEIEDYGIQRFPATVLLGTRDTGIRFFGITAGEEFTSLPHTVSGCLVHRR